MTPDQERWAETQQVLKMHGDNAEAFCWSRIAELSGDAAGQERWREIRYRVRQLAGRIAAPCH